MNVCGNGNEKTPYKHIVELLGALCLKVLLSFLTIRVVHTE